jgi:tight adherence protein B
MRFATYLIIFITLISSAILLRGKMKKEALVRDRSNALPEVIELIISGLQSGMSISETLESLGNIGPKHVQTDFKRFAENLREGSEFQLEIEKLKDQFKDSNADQLFETLIYANAFGGRNTIKILHELTDFLAEDIAIRSEIMARFGWIKNSAVLAAIAPWLLLLILRTQESARIAYQQSTGQIFLLTGVFTSVIAYFWMQKIAQLPKSKRVFIPTETK